MTEEKDGIISSPGLRTVGYIPTELCLLDEKRCQLLYRGGYDVAELTQHATYEECAHLLLYGALPNADALAIFCLMICRERLAIIDEFRPNRRFHTQLLLHDKNAHPMDMARTLVSLLGANNLVTTPEDARVTHAIKLMAALPVFVAAIQLIFVLSLLN